MESNHITKNLDLVHMGMNELKKNDLKLLTPYFVNNKHAVLLFPVRESSSSAKVTAECARRFMVSESSSLCFRRCQKVLTAEKCHISYQSVDGILPSTMECFLKGRLSNNFVLPGSREVFRVMGNYTQIRYDLVIHKGDEYRAVLDDEEELAMELDSLSLSENWLKNKKETDLLEHPFCVEEGTDKLVAFKCTRDTEFIVNKERENTNVRLKTSEVRIFGLETQKKTLHNLMERIVIPELAECLEHSVLICGPPGCGKTLLARWCLSQSKYAPFELNKHQLTSKYLGEAEKKLEKLFEEIKQRLPAILLIDRIDEQFPHRDDNSGHMNAIDRRLVMMLVQQIEEMKSQPLIVLGTSSDPSNMDKALRIGFGKELFIPLPSADVRREIFFHSLAGKHVEVGEAAKEAAITQLHGYSGADIIRFTKAALELALSREDSPPVLLASDFVSARSAVPPAGLRGLVSDTEPVHWADIGGMETLKTELQQLLHIPLSRPELYRSFQLSIPSGVLLYGPPGCSKTMMAKALATETGLSFVSLNPSDLFKRFVGESEAKMRSVVMRARAAAPAILFIDEIDTLLPARTDGAENPVSDRILAELLTALDGVHGRAQICLLGATNRPDKLDAALLRPGRMDRIIYVPLPDADTRRAILQVHLSRLSILASDEEAAQMVQRTDGFSGAEVVSVVQRAKHVAMNDYLNGGRENAEVYVTDFFKALDNVTPRTSREQLLIYEKFASKGIE